MATDMDRAKLDRDLAELRQREKRYRTLYNNAPAMMHSVDVAGDLANGNDFWLETPGYSYMEVIGRGPARRSGARRILLRLYDRLDRVQTQRGNYRAQPGPVAAAQRDPNDGGRGGLGGNYRRDQIKR